MRLTHEGGAGIQLERLNDFRISKLARVARTFQNIRLFPGMTALENLMVAQHNALMRASGFTFLGLIGVPTYRNAEKRAIALATDWLKRINLLDRADDAAGNLAYGDQRRLEIARAMCTEPALLCLDEPAAGLNAREGVDVEIKAGEIVALIGANRAGKSTLMMTIFGKPRARAGQILYEGRDITDVPTHEIAHLRIAQSPEGRRIFPRMSVAENLQMGADATGCTDAERDATLQRVFSLFPALKER